MGTTLADIKLYSITCTQSLSLYDQSLCVLIYLNQVSSILVLYYLEDLEGMLQNGNQQCT